MTESVLATYSDVTTVEHAEEDLRSTGIPLEKIRVDLDRYKVRVTIPDVT